MLLVPAGVWADTPKAVFASVTGRVVVKDAQGKHTRQAQKDATVAEGETVKTGAGAQAVLRLFDGSQVTVSPDTNFVLEKMEQPTLKDKVFRFKIELGKLLAMVNKLTSARSSFEIEAGGVVCGVRGTQYSMEYDPATGKVNVFVSDGTVWSSANGQTQVLHGGQGGSWLKGTWTPQSPSSNPSTTGNPHPGFIASNPFYGFNSIGSDDFENRLTNLPGGLPGLTGQIGNNGVAGLGGHVNLNLKLGFPQYQVP